MTNDQRNSMKLWIWAAALFGFFWVATRFDPFAGLSATTKPLSNWIGLIALGALVVGSRKWGGSNADKPDQDG